MGQVAFIGQLANRIGGVYLFSEGAIARIAGQGDPIPRAPVFVNALPVVIKGIQDYFRVFTLPGDSGLFDEFRNSIVRPGDPAPGGGVFTSVGDVSSSQSGQVAFAAGLSTGGGGVFLSSGGTIHKIVRPGDPTPGGGAFLSASSPTVNTSGQVAFVGSLSSPPPSGIFLFSKEGIIKVVRQGDPAPGGGTFVNVNFPTLNARGQVAFLAIVGGGRSGYFLFSDGVISPIARAEDPVPGGGTITFPFLPPLSLNAAGQAAFMADLSTGDPELEIDDVGVFLVSSGTISRIARRGDPAPGGETFNGAFSPSVDDKGQVAFQGSVLPPGRSGIFLFSEGAITAVVRSGDPAPGGGDFSGLGSPKLNGQGQVAFQGGVPDGAGAFLATPTRSTK